MAFPTRAQWPGSVAAEPTYAQRAMDRYETTLDAPGLDRPLSVIRYGHWGRPVVVFPTSGGRAHDYADRGMLDALGWLVDAGRVKLYCVDSFDHRSWSNKALDHESRAQQHDVYESWISDRVVPYIRDDSPGSAELLATGCSLGGFHALHFALRRADLFPAAICVSGAYDPTLWNTWGHAGFAAYVHNPMAYVPDLHGPHLEWLRHRLHLVLTVGRGPFEQETTCLPTTRAIASRLQAKGIWCELDEWGDDASHDWPWWQRQTVHHLQRFC